MLNRTNSNDDLKKNETVFIVPENLDKMFYEDLQTFYDLVMMSSGIEISDEDDNIDRKLDDCFSEANTAASNGNVALVNALVSDLLAYNRIFVMLKYIRKADQDNQKKSGNTLPSSYYKDLSDVMIRAAELRELDVCFKVTAHYQDSSSGNTPEKLDTIIEKTGAPALVACLTKARGEMQKKLEAKLASVSQPVTMFSKDKKNNEAAQKDAQQQQSSPCMIN